MATYVLKRKTYGLVTGVAGGVGDALDSSVGGAVGAMHGAFGDYGAGKWLGDALDSVGVPGGEILGRVGGALAEGKAVRGLGRGMKDVANGDSLI